MTSPRSPAPTLTDILARESNNVGDEIFKRIFDRSPWTQLLAKCELREVWAGGQAQWVCQLHNATGPWITAHLPNQHTTQLLREQFAIHQVIMRLEGQAMSPTFPAGMGDVISTPTCS